MKIPSLPTFGRPAKPAVAPAPAPPPSAEPEEQFERLHQLRDGLSPLVGLVLLLVTIGAASYVGYILQDGDNVSGAVFADIGIAALGLLILWFIGAITWVTDRIPWSALQRIPEPAGIRDIATAGIESMADYRRHATGKIHELLEQMIYDYGLLLTGQEPTLDYLSPQVRTVLMQAVTAVLSSGDRIRPDFGNHVEVTVNWDVAGIGQPVTATAFFIDQSTRISQSGLGVQMPRRKMKIVAALNHQFTHIIDATLGPEG